jgi:hypothetical protein
MCCALEEDLIRAEIEASQTLTGQRRRTNSAKEWICWEELSVRGLCTANQPVRITQRGINALERATNVVLLRPQRYL